ncbi:HNH endonuclease [Alkalibacterium sp. f15]|uniref:HNH endonuclease n=1 Tax=Alkalibacterium sp. f15 TaxID=3414029 RepID=UPI003BF7AAB3
MSTYLKCIPARSTQFINTKKRNIDFYEAFRMYARELTILAGNSKNVKSGKADSYSRYLVRLVYNYEMIFNDKINDLDSFFAYEKLNKLTQIIDYSIFNKNENHFPSATLNCYLSYLTFLNDKVEKFRDNEMNAQINLLSYKDSMESLTDKSISSKKNRGNKIFINGRYSYSRNIIESNKAKMNSGWKCEYNNNHKTFTNIRNKEPYIEAHHLIPMAAQDYFLYNIDFSDNIVCLCPTCHSKIHHSIYPERKKTIETLFNKREFKYEKYGIEIDRGKLLTFYGVL